MAAGLNRANWNLDYPGAVTFPGMVLWGATTNGPQALPGTYQVRLTVDGKSQTQPLVVQAASAPRTHRRRHDRAVHLALQIRDKISDANNAVIRSARSRMT